MQSALARQRLFVFLLGLIALGGWQFHDLSHCRGGEHHEEHCSICALGLAPDLTPPIDLKISITPLIDTLYLPPAAEGISWGSQAGRSVTSRGPPVR